MSLIIKVFFLQNYSLQAPSGDSQQNQITYFTYKCLAKVTKSVLHLLKKTVNLHNSKGVAYWNANQDRVAILSTSQSWFYGRVLGAA